MVQKTDISVSKTDDSATLLMKTMVGTTWRVFLPTIGLTLLGLWLDNVINMKPWLMVAGISLGFAVSFSLVWLQVAKIKRQESKDD
jgi:hypothetical protein